MNERDHAALQDSHNRSNVCPQPATGVSCVKCCTSAERAALKSSMWGFKTAKVCRAKAASWSSEKRGGPPHACKDRLTRHLLQAQIAKHLGHFPLSNSASFSALTTDEAANRALHFLLHLEDRHQTSQCKHSVHPPEPCYRGEAYAWQILSSQPSFVHL